MINLDRQEPQRAGQDADSNGRGGFKVGTASHDLKMTEHKLRQFFERGLLALKPDDILVYEPVQVIKVCRHKIRYRAISKIDQSYKILTVFNKQALALNSEAELCMKKIGYLKEFNPAIFKFYENNMFFFCVENDRTYVTLWDVIRRPEGVNERTAKFIFYGILKELKRLHEQGLAHMNLTPSAVGFDSNGFVFLQRMKFVHRFYGAGKSDADFDWIHERKKNWYCVAPELLKDGQPDHSSDFYALGVLFYLILIKKLPFLPASMNEYVELLNQVQVKIKKNQIPEGWTLECVDFINRLIVRNKELRLGTFGGAKELLSHNFFADYASEYRHMVANQTSPILGKEEPEDVSKYENEEEEDEAEQFENKKIDLAKLTEFFNGLKKLDAKTENLFDGFADLFDN